MNFKKVLGVCALMSVLVLGVSCEKETVSESDELLSIEREDIKEEDT